MANAHYGEKLRTQPQQKSEQTAADKKVGITQNQATEIQVFVLSKLLPTAVAAGMLAGLASKIF